MFEVDHVAAAVEDLDAAVEGFAESAGAEYVWTHESEEWLYRTAYMLAGSDMFTLIAPTDPEGFIRSYLDSRGPGLHHIGVNVEDLEATLEAVTAAGGEVITEASVEDVREEATLHPTSWFGLQVQFIEWDDAVGPTAREHVEAMREAKADGRL